MRLMRNIPIFEKNLDIFLRQIVCAKPRAPQAAARGSGMSGEHAQEGFVELAIVIEDRRSEAFVVPGDRRLVRVVDVAAGEDFVTVAGRIEEVARLAAGDAVTGRAIPLAVLAGLRNRASLPGPAGVSVTIIVTAVDQEARLLSTNHFSGGLSYGSDSQSARPPRNSLPT